MWRSEQGEVVLRGAAGEVFTDALWGMVDGFQYEADSPVSSEVQVFARLSGGQQIAALHQVGRAAILEDVPSPRLTAVIEGTFAAVFLDFATSIDGESHDEEPRSDARALVLAAAKERNVSAPWDAQHVGYKDWFGVLEELVSTYLWDADYETGDELVDMPPEAARRIHKDMGLLDDYYTWFPQDYTASEAKDAALELIDLCRDYERGRGGRPPGGGAG